MIDWRRVKSTLTLQKISELYKANRRFEECRDILLLAYDRNPSNRNVVYSLCEVSLEFDDILNAIEYFKEFTKLSPRDPQAYVLRYKIYEAQNVAIEERIELLEELKKKDRIEEWEYQLAYLYHRAGMKTQCVEECDEFILWFGEGPYVMKAMELKMLHEPLSPQQQQKYDRFCEERLQNGVAISEPNEDGVDFRVKTINIGAYNTMDLQAELAENLKKVIDMPDDDVEPLEDDMTSIVYTEPEEEAVVTQKTVVDKQEVFFEDKTEDLRFQVQQPEQSEGVDPNLEAWKRDFADKFSNYEAPESYGQLQDAEQEQSQNTVPTDEPVVTNMMSDAVTQKTPVVTVPIPPISTRDVKEVYSTQGGVVAGSATRIGGFETILSQGGDGQISFVVPEQTKQVEKQITGQLNINDILADWERMKKENEQKRQEEVRKRVLEQTGQIFTDFDLSTRNDMLAGLDDTEEMSREEEALIADKMIEDTVHAVSEVAVEAATTKVLPTDDENRIPPEEMRMEVIAETTEPDAEEEMMLTEGFEIVAGAAAIEGVSIAEDAAEGIEAEAAMDTILSTEDTEEKFYGSVTGEIPGSIWKEVAEAEAKEQKIDVVSLEEEGTSSDSDDEETMGVYGEEESEEEAAEPAEEAADVTQDEPSRVGEPVLTPEDEQLFEPFLYSKKMLKQIAGAIDHISLASYAGNVIISGEAGSGAMHLAKCLVRHVQSEDGNFSGNVAKISGETLNRKDVTSIISKLSNGALIIEKANQMESKTIDSILKQINHEGNGILILLLDRKKEIEKLLEKSPALIGFFDVKITILPMNNDVLVEYGRRYAYDLEYSIDEMGVLALYKRISDMQNGRHAVTVVEVKKIIDEAIKHSKKKTLSAFANVLSGKRYDEEDMIILKEKDFIK